MTAPEYGWGYRISHALWAAVVNVALWLVIPTLIFDVISGILPSSPIPLGTTFIYSFGITITALQVLGALTVGSAISVPFKSGADIAEAYYIWSAVQGGLFSFSVQGLAVTLSFPTLAFLLILAPLFNAVRAPIAYLLDQSEASLPSPDLA
jgi:hypothetical protein